MVLYHLNQWFYPSFSCCWWAIIGSTWWPLAASVLRATWVGPACDSPTAWSNFRCVYVMWLMHYNAYTVGWNIHTAEFNLDEFQLENWALNFESHVVYWLCSLLKPKPKARAECKQPASSRSHDDCAITPYVLTCAFSAFCQRQM